MSVDGVNRYARANWWMREKRPCARSYAVATTPCSAAMRSAVRHRGVSSMRSTRLPHASNCVSVGSLSRSASCAGYSSAESRPISRSDGSTSASTPAGSSRASSDRSARSSSNWLPSVGGACVKLIIRMRRGIVCDDEG